VIVLVRFPAEMGVEVAAVEEAVQSCVGRAGSVIGASSTSIDVEVTDLAHARSLMESLAAELRAMDLPAATYFDIPSSGQRFGINDF